MKFYFFILLLLGACSSSGKRIEGIYGQDLSGLKKRLSKIVDSIKEGRNPVFICMDIDNAKRLSGHLSDRKKLPELRDLSHPFLKEYCMPQNHDSMIFSGRENRALYKIQSVQSRIYAFEKTKI